MLIQLNDDLCYLNVNDENYIIHDNKKNVIFTIDYFGSFLIDQTKNKIELKDLINTVMENFELVNLDSEVEKYISVLINKGILISL